MLCSGRRGFVLRVVRLPLELVLLIFQPCSATPESMLARQQWSRSLLKWTGASSPRREFRFLSHLIARRLWDLRWFSLQPYSAPSRPHRVGSWTVPRQCPCSMYVMRAALCLFRPANIYIYIYIYPQCSPAPMFCGGRRGGWIFAHSTESSQI